MCHHLKPRRIRQSRLRDRDFQNLSVQRQCAPVDFSVPIIHMVVRPAAERPDRQIESKGQRRFEQKCCRPKAQVPHRLQMAARSCAQSLVTPRGQSRSTRIHSPSSLAGFS